MCAGSSMNRRCHPLRRTVWAVVLGRGFGFLLVVAAVTLVVSALVESEAGYWLGALGCVALWVITTPPAVRLCPDAIEVRPRFSRSERYDLVDLLSISVGRVREGHGYSGYSGFALVLERRDGSRLTLPQSQHCGRRRLEQWAEKIVNAELFDGERISTGGAIVGGRQQVVIE